MIDRYVGAARRAGLRARADRRSRHERQAPRRRPAGRDLPAGLCSTSGSAPARRASSCRSPIPTSCITARSARSPPSICRQAAGPRGLLAALRDRRASSWRSTAEEACRSASSCRPTGSATSWSSPTGTRCSAPRLRGTTSRASTEPLRSHGGLTEQDVPMIVNRRVAAAAGPRAAQFRRLRRRPQPRRVREPTMDTRPIPPTSAARRCASPASGSTTDDALEVRNPYNGALVGTVPPRRARACRARPSPIAHDYKPKLTRYERQQILLDDRRAAGARKEEICPADHRRVRPVPEGLALRGRPRLRRLHLRGPARHQGRRRDLLLRHHPARQAAQDLHHARSRCSA